MADVTSNNGWTKTELGDGWVKLSEVCDVFDGCDATGAVFTTPITNTTSNAVTDGPSMPVINELKDAGEFMVEVIIGATTTVADTHILALNSAGTYTRVTTDLIADQAQSTTAMASYSGAITNGLQIEVEKDSGAGANTLTVNLIYYNGGPNMSDVTIGGVGADPS